MYWPQSRNTTRESMLSQYNREKLMQIFPTRMCNVTVWRLSRPCAHWLLALVGRGGVSYLSFVYGRSLWTELNGGENFLHWKANMLPLFSIMTLWYWRKETHSQTWCIAAIGFGLLWGERLQHWLTPFKLPLELNKLANITNTIYTLTL